MTIPMIPVSVCMFVCLYLCVMGVTVGAFLLPGSGDDGNVLRKKGSKVLLKGMRYTELEVCVNFYISCSVFLIFMS